MTTRPHKGGGKLAKKMKKLHERRLGHAATLRSIPLARQGGYRAPGSMNEHK